MSTSIEDRLQKIEERNKRVELDKKWETSWTRKISILCLTYGVVACFLIFIHKEDPFINAVVPPIGFLLSTLVLKKVRHVWQKIR